MKSEKEISGKFRQFQRVLISYIDFKQASQISSLILSEELHANYPRENRILLEALNCAMIVAYCRPFSGSDARAATKVPDLPNRFLRSLSKDEREIHDTVMEDRNSVLAHSDSEAWNMVPQYLRLGDDNVLLPVSAGVHRPLTQEATQRFNELSGKLMEAMFVERETLENELRDYLPVIEP